MAWALELAGRGWPVFPLRAGTKQPALHGDRPGRPCPRTGSCAGGHRGWEQLATVEPGLIEAGWARHPDRNIGIACGPAGLVVIDLDVPKPGSNIARSGADLLAELAGECGESVAQTWTVHTPGGGSHLYYQAPAGIRLRTTRGRLGRLIDTSAWGGYVVAPSSTLAVGGYELVDDRDPVPLPAWLLERLNVAPSRPSLIARRVASGDLDAYVAGAIRRQTELVQSALPGTSTHNHSLNVAAFNLGQLVGAGAVAEDYVRNLLWLAAAPRIRMPCDCDAHEIRRVIALGLQAGAKRPRDLGHLTPAAATIEDSTRVSPERAT